jgi:hypothetical protein
MKKSTVILRLTEAEKLQMKIKAKMVGLTLSAYIRFKTLQDEKAQFTN